MNRPVDLQAAALTGADAVVEMLKAHGVEVIFGLCGDTSLPLYDALARSGSCGTSSRATSATPRTWPTATRG